MPVWCSEKIVFAATLAAAVASAKDLVQSARQQCVAEIRFQKFRERVGSLRGCRHSALKLTLCRVGKKNREVCLKLEQVVGSWRLGSADAAPVGRGGRALPIDRAVLGLNNPGMPRPEAAHRVKSYSAATGYVYQYYFYEVEKSKRGGAAGTEYVYMASVDRKHVFPVRIFVRKDAVEKWSTRTGREFTGTEEYAVAKMRLFQAFDEVQGLAAKTPDLVVDESNLDALLSQLDL